MGHYQADRTHQDKIEAANIWKGLKVERSALGMRECAHCKRRMSEARYARSHGDNCMDIN